MLLYFDRWVGLSVTIAEVACVVSVRFNGELTILYLSLWVVQFCSARSKF